MTFQYQLGKEMVTKPYQNFDPKTERLFWSQVEILYLFIVLGFLKNFHITTRRFFALEKTYCLIFKNETSQELKIKYAMNVYMVLSFL